MKNFQNKPLVVLKNIKTGQAFYSSTHPNAPTHDYSKLADGTVAYEVVGFFDSSKECQNELQEINGPFSLYDYIKKSVEDFNQRSKKSGLDAIADPEHIFELCKQPGDLRRT